MQWSQYQESIFTAVSDDARSLLVEAVAGSGKTTTLVELINRIPQGKRTIFLAFNKAIAEELKKRVNPARAQCRTLHAVGLAAWKQYLDWDANNCEVDGNKMREIINAKMSWPQRQKYGQMGKLIGLAKGAGIVPEPNQINGSVGGDLLALLQHHEGLTKDTNEEWLRLVEFYDCDQFVNDWGELDEAGIDLARKVLAESILTARDTIDYDDMMYMPIIAGAKFDPYDVVLLDEAQDVNSMQVEIVRRLLAPGGRVIAVGDPHQAIYGFRGALAGSMGHIADMFKAERLPLSVSYRCAKQIVTTARRFVSHIEPFEGSPEGLVETPACWDMRAFRSQDAILCRLNAPLVTLAFTLIRNKVPCRIAGRDIASGLTSLVKRMKALSITDLTDKLKRYYAREVVKANGDAGKLSRVQDRLDTIHVFIDELGMDDTVDTLIGSIEGMFSDMAGGSGLLTLSTVHKAKGLEWDTVYILDADKFMPLPWAKDGWQRDQEYNLCYVAATRAKRTLRYITSEGLGLHAPESIEVDEAALRIAQEEAR